MSTDDIINMRLKSLEDWRSEQQEMNRTITDSLHRIELALTSQGAKACPNPGHCNVLDGRLTAINVKLDTHEGVHGDLYDRLNKCDNTLSKGFGALAVLVFVTPALTWFVVHYLIK
jgi:hypothetical protein